MTKSGLEHVMCTKPLYLGDKKIAENGEILTVRCLTGKKDSIYSDKFGWVCDLNSYIGKTHFTPYYTK